MTFIALHFKQKILNFILPEATNYYTNCVRQDITKGLRNLLNCNLPGFDGLLLKTELNLPACQNHQSAFTAAEIFQNVSYEFLAGGAFKKCHMPCKQKRYVQNLKYYHQTSYNYFNDTYFELIIAYSTLDVTTKMETLVYDFGDFIAAAGGNLGLFLGFSCLGCIWQIIDNFQAWHRQN